MKILIACESSGATRDAFIALGHDAMSCDLLPTVVPGPHHQGDVREVLNHAWDMVIAHPTCTYLSSSGLHWNTRPEGIAINRAGMTEDAIAFARIFIDGPETAHIPRRAVENPIGCLSSRVRKPDQIIQPHQFGDDASKATCLWLHGLPKLQPTAPVAPRLVEGNGKVYKRWANQTDSGQNKLGPSADRWRIRSVTYAGIANAFATQWGSQ
jgi:hypothetical protein